MAKPPVPGPLMSYKSVKGGFNLRDGAQNFIPNSDGSTP